jgi:hypothetical protein
LAEEEEKRMEKRTALDEAIAAEAERRLLEAFNQDLEPLEMVTDDAFVGIWLTPDVAGRIYRHRRRARFASLQEVLSIPGIDAEGVDDVLRRWSRRPVLEWPASDADRAAVDNLWRRLRRDERRRVGELLPTFTPDACLAMYSSRVVVSMQSAGAIALPWEGLGEEVTRRIWREFWKRVAAWLAKRGIAIGVVAAADGPLPIGDIIALGLSVWAIYELIQLWDTLFEEVALAVTIDHIYQQAMSKVAELEHHITNKLCGQLPTDNLWGYYIKEIVAKLIEMYLYVVKIPAGKKHDEALKAAKELLQQFRDAVKKKSPDTAAEIEEYIEKKFMEKGVPD